MHRTMSEILKAKLAAKNEVNSNEIPRFLEPKLVRPKKKKSAKITQALGSMSRCDILKKSEELEKVKDDTAELKEMKAQLQLYLRH